MILTSIGITGFKSFPEKTEITLSPGITVVVGPNGCGKSNLVDAIRWVLGEQSVKLMRGNRMEELIFSGTANRNALNYASVTLHFEEVNAVLPVEYQAVSVSRRIYRSGEGEYYLNKKPCRLKDINELFLDTGIGTETYSLIGQGRVEQLINARPEEHRELFEEAAKIHKYKQRKKEARGRLEEMYRNLLRVDDLLAEFQDQKERLVEEVARARQVKKLREELKSVERALITRQWARNQEALEKIEGERERLQEKSLEKTLLLETLVEKLETSQDREKALNEQLERVRDHFQQQKEALEALQGRVQLVRQKIQYDEEKIAYKGESLLEVQGRINGLEETVRKNKAELQAVQGEQKELGKKAALLSEQLRGLQHGNNMALLETARDELSACSQKKAALEQRIEDDERRDVEMQQQRTALEKLLQQKEEKLQEWKGREQELLAEKRQLDLEKVRLDQQAERLAGEAQAKEEALRKKKQLLLGLNRDLEKKKSRSRYLKESEEDFSYFSYGVKSVMQWASKDPGLQGIYGPFIQLIQVLPQYEKALEVALGASMQFIVVSDDEQARQAIEYLKSRQAGKATFLPLNMLRISRKELPSRSLEGLIDRASQLVEAPALYKKAVDYLLGGTLVAQDLGAALKMARQLPAGWRIVTLDGEMITPGGAISGGSTPRSGGDSFLARKRERTTLETEIGKLTEREKTELQELGRLERQLQEGQEKQNALQRKQVETAASLDKKVDELERTAVDLQKGAAEAAAAKLENDELLARCKQLDRQRLARSEELQDTLNRARELQGKIAELGRQVQLEEKRQKEIQEERVEIRVRFSACQEKESALQNILATHREEKERLQELAAALQGEKDRLKAELAGNRKEERTLLDRLEKDKEQNLALETELQKLQEAARAGRMAAAEQETQLEKERRTLERLQKRLQNLQVESVRHKEAGRYLGEQLLEKYQLDTNSISPADFADGETEEGRLQEKQRLESELADLGETDLGVIDEFEKLQQRTHFLEEQKKDLLEGEKGVRSVLSELDRHMEKRFTEALQAIEVHFKDVFQKLFGGGQALLKLTDPENVLEAGIEIVAQPPGKKLQNISLLSGGEKALTAIALLFALLRYNPVPFCVLDEIDSSLDENNLTRFLHYLKEYAGNTQFVVITHKRRTMEEADVLYGITMEEHGISKVISLNLSQKAG